MSRQVANVDIITDSFELWLLKTNDLLNALSTEIITANTTVANTGNNTISRTAQLWGTFGANNVVVTDALRGGNVSTGVANLVITTNATAYVAAAADIRVLAGNTTSNSFINPIGVYLGQGTANSFVNSIAIITQSNSTVNTNIRPTLIQITNSTATANITPTAFTTGIFTGNTTTVAVGANVYANATTVFVGNSSASIAHGNSTITGSANVQILPTSYMHVTGAFTVSSNVALSNTLSVIGATTLSNTLSAGGAANLLSTLGVTGAANALSTLGVTGATTLANTLSVTGNTSFSNITTFQTDYVVDVSSNANIGATTGSGVLVYRFTKATYSSGKFEVQVKNGNTQLSELVLAHDNASNAFVTVYGTVASNGGASPLGTFIANTDAANVNLYLVQTVANSAVKVVAHLIK
jgi:hypothetical protein